MNREIKFRGRDIHKNEWVYGYAVYTEHVGIGWHIFQNMQFSNSRQVEFVNQYIGLKDKNGIDIYEGDIIRMHQFLFDGNEIENELTGVITFTNSEFSIAQIYSTYWQENTGHGPGEDSGTPLCNFYGLHEESFEVIGNIYENPELLKGGKNDLT